MAAASEVQYVRETEQERSVPNDRDDELEARRRSEKGGRGEEATEEDGKEKDDEEEEGEKEDEDDEEDDDEEEEAMFTVRHVIVVVCNFCAAVCFIVALASPHWMGSRNSRGVYGGLYTVCIHDNQRGSAEIDKIFSSECISCKSAKESSKGNGRRQATHR